MGIGVVCLKNIDKTKEFEVKKEKYKEFQNKLISNNLDDYLTKNILAYRGDARHLLYDGKILGTYFYGDSMLTMHNDHYYILPKGFGFLVYGTIDVDYYEWFKEDEYALDLNLEKALNYMLTYPEFAIAIDDLQRIEDSYERIAEQQQIAARIKSINNKTLIGKLKNIFINN